MRCCASTARSVPRWQLRLAVEHRRGRGHLDDASDAGHLDDQALRDQLTGLPLPRSQSSRLVLAVDIST